MNQNEKCELLKSTIYQLYSKEGRSRVYISDLLKLNRKVLGDKIKEWNLPEPEPKRHASPSMQKFINKNRQLIKSRLDQNIAITQIAMELKCGTKTLYTSFLHDDVLQKAHESYINRQRSNANMRKEGLMEQSRLQYDFEQIDGEEWKEILGYPDYQVSNMGRVKRLAKSYNRYYLLRTQFNAENNRVYVTLHNEHGHKNMQLARLVAHAFCEGYSDENNTANHKDGNVQNNKADNLEWTSQSDNNKHSYRKLNRRKNVAKPLTFYILYQNKYRFKTVASFAKFIGKSETQVRRYLEEPEKYDITLIQK